MSSRRTALVALDTLGNLFFTLAAGSRHPAPVSCVPQPPGARPPAPQETRTVQGAVIMRLTIQGKRQAQ